MWLTLIALVGAIVLSVIYAKSQQLWSVWIAIALWICFVVSAISWLVCYVEAIDDYGKLMAFAKVQTYYQDTIQQTKAAVVKLDQKPIPDQKTITSLTMLGISVENLRQSNFTSGRIKEWRDYQQWFEETLFTYKSRKTHWITSQFFPKLPAEIQ